MGDENLIGEVVGDRIHIAILVARQVVSKLISFFHNHTYVSNSGLVTCIVSLRMSCPAKSKAVTYFVSVWQSEQWL